MFEGRALTKPLTRTPRKSPLSSKTAPHRARGTTFKVNTRRRLRLPLAPKDGPERMSTIKHTASFYINQPVKVLFPLFSAEGEKSWVPGWDYENIMGSTDLREDYVFVTKGHDHAATDAIWLVKRYEPEEYLVQFYKVEPGEKVGVIEVRCFELSDSETDVRVSYEYIGLSARGDEFVDGFSSSAYEEFIAEWKGLLEVYVEEKR